MIESQALLGCGSAPPTLEGLGAAGTMPSDYLVDGGLTKNDDIEWAHGSPFPKGKSGNPGGELNNSRNVSAYAERLRRTLLVD